MTTNKKIVLGVLILVVIVIVFIILKKKKKNKTNYHLPKTVASSLAQLPTIGQQPMSNSGLKDIMMHS